MIRSISSMSSIMPARVASSRASISMPRRSRASGVRRSCETPASSSARSCSSWRRFAIIRLKPRFRLAISDGPVSGSGGGVSPRPTRSTVALELAQRPREVAREQERGGEQHRRERRGSRAPRATGGPRPAVAAAAESRPSSRCPPASTRTSSSPRPGATRSSVPGPSASRSRSSRSCNARSDGRPAHVRPLALGHDAHAVLAADAGRATRAARARRRLSSAARTACSCTILVSPNWRASSAARSWRNSRIVAATAIATTASSSSASRPNSERGQERHRASSSGGAPAASSSGTNT